MIILIIAISVIMAIMLFVSLSVFLIRADKCSEYKIINLTKASVSNEKT